MQTAANILKEALCLDFTGKMKQFQQCSVFDDQTIALIRDSKKSQVVIIDYGFGQNHVSPLLVRDHMNISGNNPLVGPNHPCGERFPAINNAYITKTGIDAIDKLKTTVVAAVKPGLNLSTQEMDLIETLGANCYCYYLVPSVITAAHAKKKVVGILVPKEAKFETELLEAFSKDN